MSLVRLICNVLLLCSMRITKGDPNLDLYYIPPSPPCRIVLMIGKMLGLDFSLTLVNLQEKEQYKPEFLKLNPLHTVPVLRDNDLVLSESRAISTYLISRYGKDDSLYPNDPKKRAIVDQRLYYDIGTLYQRFIELYMPMINEGADFNPGKAKSLNEALNVLEIYLTENDWAAGDHITIADISLIASLSTIEAMNFDITKFSRIMRWYDQCKSVIPDYKEINQDGADEFRSIAEKLKQYVRYQFFPCNTTARKELDRHE